MQNTTGDPAALPNSTEEHVPIIPPEESGFSLGVFDPQRVQLTPTGLILAEGIEFEEWKVIGKNLRAGQKSIDWCVGDWLAYGDWNYSKRMPNGVYELASKIFDLAPKTLKNYKWISSNIKPSHRLDSLTMKHGEELVCARVSEELMPVWINEIDEKSLSTRQLRHRLRDENKDHQPEPHDKPKQTVFGQANKFVIAFVHENRDWDKAQEDEMADILSPVRDWLHSRDA